MKVHKQGNWYAVWCEKNRNDCLMAGMATTEEEAIQLWAETRHCGNCQNKWQPEQLKEETGVLESEIERKFVQAVEALGGEAIKLTSPNNAGLPDRLVLLPNGRMFFVELKAPGKKPRPLQTRQIERLKELGFSVYVVDNMDKGLFDVLQPA